MATLPYNPQRTVGPSGQDTANVQYVEDRGNSPAAFGAGLARALEGFGQTVEGVSLSYAREQKQIRDFALEADFNDWKSQQVVGFEQAQQKADPTGIGFMKQATGSLDQSFQQFLKERVPQEKVQEFTYKYSSFRGQMTGQAISFEQQQQQQYSQLKVREWGVKAQTSLDQNPDQLAARKAEGAQFIDQSALLPIQKEAQKQAQAEALEMAAMNAKGRREPHLIGTFEERLIKRENASREPRTINRLGYVGNYQFGAPRLAELGLYDPLEGEGRSGLAGWSKRPGGADKWTGRFNIPGFPEVRTIEDFRNSPEAQRAAFTVHTQRMDQEIQQRGLAKYEGTQVGGVTLTREGLYAMMHLGGAAGAERVLEGRGDPSDANGTRISEYAKLGQGGAGGLVNDPQFSNVSLDKKLAIAAHAEQEARQADNQAAAQARLQRQEFVNNFSYGIVDGKLGRAELMEARESGLLPDVDDYLKLENMIEQRYEKIGTMAEAVRKLASPEAWSSKDADDRKRQNVFLEADQGALRLSKMDTNFVNQALLPLGAKTQMFAPDAINTLHGMSRSPDTKKMYWAFQTLDQMDRTARGSLPEDVEKDVMQWRVLSQYKLPEEVSEILREVQEPAVIEGRKRLATSLQAKDSPLSLKVTLPNILNHFDEGLFSAEPLAPGGEQATVLHTDAINLFTEAYTRNGGNAKAAEADMYRLLDKRWRATDVGGEHRLMKYAPETEHQNRPLNNSYDWLNSQAREQMSATGMPEGERFWLHADAQTEAERSAGRPGTYVGMYWPEGSPMPVVARERIKFDFGKAKMGIPILPSALAPPDRPNTQDILKDPWRGQDKDYVPPSWDMLGKELSGFGERVRESAQERGVRLPKRDIE